MISKHSRGKKSHNVPSSRYVLAASLLLAMVILYSQINLSAATGFAAYSVVKVDTEKGTYFALQPQEEKAAVPITGMQVASPTKYYLCARVRDNKLDCTTSCDTDDVYVKDGPFDKAACEKAKASASQPSPSTQAQQAVAQPSKKLKCTDKDEYGRIGECTWWGFGRKQLEGREGCGFWEGCVLVGPVPKCSAPPIDGRCTKIAQFYPDGKSECDQLGGTVFQGIVEECGVIQECCINIGGKKEPPKPAEPSALNPRQKAEAEARTKQREIDAKKAPVRPPTPTPAKLKPAAVSQNVFACSVYDETTLTEKIYCRQKCGADAGELPYDRGFDVLKAEGYKPLSDCQAALNKYKDTLKPGDVLGSVPTEKVLRERTRAAARARPIEKIDIGTVQLVFDGNKYDRYAVIIKYGAAAAEQKYKLCRISEPGTTDTYLSCETECPSFGAAEAENLGKDECEAKRSGAPATPAKRTYCDQLKGECISSSSEAYSNCVIGKGWLRSSASSRESQSCVSANQGDTCCLTWGAKRESLGEKGTTANCAAEGEAISSDKPKCCSADLKPDELQGICTKQTAVPQQQKPSETIGSFPYGPSGCVKEGDVLERSGAKCCEGLVSQNKKCVKETPAAAQETYQLCKDSFGRYQCYSSGKSGCLSTLYADRECTVTTAQSKAAGATANCAKEGEAISTDKRTCCTSDLVAEYSESTGQDICVKKPEQTLQSCSCEYDIGADAYVYKGLGCSRTLETCSSQGQNYYACLTKEGSYGCVSDTSLCSSDWESFGSDKAGCTAKAEQLKGAGRPTSGENVLYGCAVTDATTDVAYSYWCVKDASECLGSYEAYEGDTAEADCWAWADSANERLSAQAGGGGTGGEDDDLDDDDFVPASCVNEGYYLDVSTQSCCSGDAVPDDYGDYYCPYKTRGESDIFSDTLRGGECVEQYYSVSEGQACCSGAEPAEDDYGFYCP